MAQQVKDLAFSLLGTGSIPGPGTSTRRRCSQEKKKKKNSVLRVKQILSSSANILPTNILYFSVSLHAAFPFLCCRLFICPNFHFCNLILAICISLKEDRFTQILTPQKLLTGCLLCLQILFRILFSSLKLIDKSLYYHVTTLK